MLADAVATTGTPVSVNQSHLGDIARAGTPVPDYDRTRLRPGIVHVGVGGFHRAHLALYTRRTVRYGFPSHWQIRPREKAGHPYRFPGPGVPIGLELALTAASLAVICVAGLRRRRA